MKANKYKIKPGPKPIYLYRKKMRLHNISTEELATSLDVALSSIPYIVRNPKQHHWNTLELLMLKKNKR